MSTSIYFLTLLGVFAACGENNSPVSIDTSLPVANNAPGKTGSTVDRTNFLDIDRFPLERLISTGVGKDGIPALTDPVFTSATSPGASYLSDSDLILGVTLHGQNRAYPHNIGWHHEVINDMIENQPIIITFCPLTGTGLVFDGGGTPERREMGVSGLLFNNNLVLYDRTDGVTLFPQMIHTSIKGTLTGQELWLLPVVETTWGYWKELYPNTTVISGYTPGAYNINQYRDYPYLDYRERHVLPLFSLYPEARSNPIFSAYPPKEMVLGVRYGNTTRAYPATEMGDEAVINDTVAGNNILVVFYKAAKMAIPYSRDHAGRTLTFKKTASTDTVYPFMLKDQETGSLWNLKGQAIDGPLNSSVLRQ
ncbi:MAG: DUF3179 domain-containing protein, partial [bacterium]|nr:DUF3179 domain-containing protein [bacterium]